MVKDFISKSLVYLVLLLVMFLVFSYLGIYHYSLINSVDKAVHDFVSGHVNQYLTFYFKVITNLGGILFFVVFLVLCLVMFKEKKYAFMMTFNLLFTYIFSVIFKNIFRRERPLYNLIKLPSDYSFPSGHAMCSVAFYGFLMFLVSKCVSSKKLRVFFYILLTFVLLSISFSRIYLGVHYFSDVLCGFLFGVVCLIMFVNYVKIRDMI